MKLVGCGKSLIYRINNTLDYFASARNNVALLAFTLSVCCHCKERSDVAIQKFRPNRNKKKLTFSEASISIFSNNFGRRFGDS